MPTRYAHADPTQKPPMLLEHGKDPRAAVGIVAMGKPSKPPIRPDDGTTARREWAHGRNAAKTESQKESYEPGGNNFKKNTKKQKKTQKK